MVYLPTESHIQVLTWQSNAQPVDYKYYALTITLPSHLLLLQVRPGPQGTNYRKCQSSFNWDGSPFCGSTKSYRVL